MDTFDVVVIGGGIVGLATAGAVQRLAELSLLVSEGEDRLAAHQTGHNSGVIHSGLYYKPGSLKAQNCVEGRRALYRFCEEQGIAHEACGKIVVATDDLKIEALKRLEERGRANGLIGVRRLGPEELKEYEPFVRGRAGLWIPETGIVDYTEVAEAYARLIKERGGEIRTGARVTGFRREAGFMVLDSSKGPVRCRFLVNCAGLQSDRVARMCGLDPKVRIVPFRGEYYELKPDRHGLVRNLIYPVPDPKFPFLGVHFTRMIRGGVEAGPNAVLSFKREGYSKWSFSLADTLDFALFPGFWRMASKYWRTGSAEIYRSFSKKAFVRSLKQLVPDLEESDIRPGGAGVRAQALSPTGALLDDFHIEEGEGMVHVLNAPSPAATASLSIGKTVAARAAKVFGLSR